MINAYSPQAKERIERLWSTLQSRLLVEFKVHGINTMETANVFLEEFMKAYNKKFGIEPENPEEVFRQLDSNINLDNILSLIDEKCKKVSALPNLRLPF